MWSGDAAEECDGLKGSEQQQRLDRGQGTVRVYGADFTGYRVEGNNSS